MSRFGNQRLDRYRSHMLYNDQCMEPGVSQPVTNISWSHNLPNFDSKEVKPIILNLITWKITCRTDSMKSISPKASFSFTYIIIWPIIAWKMLAKAVLCRSTSPCGKKTINPFPHIGVYYIFYQMFLKSSFVDLSYRLSIQL